MVESRDELLMEIVRETGLDHMGEDAEDEEEDEDADDGEDAAAPSIAAPPPPAPPTAAPEEIDDEGPVDMIPEQEAPMAHEVILADAEPEMLQSHLYHALMRDYVTPRVTLFPNYLHYKLNQASSAMINQVVEVQNQNSKSGV
jgi:hypothetical protein